MLEKDSRVNGILTLAFPSYPGGKLRHAITS
jgi:hypothetical protein